MSIESIAWSPPLLPQVRDTAWEAKVRDRLKMVPDIFTRVAPSEWIRATVLEWPFYAVQHFPTKLAYVAELIVAQENACRYCYGVAKAHLRSQGYSERFIDSIERNKQLAEMDQREGVFVQFCRSLSRSSPRPPSSFCQDLIDAGYSQKAVTEMTWWIVMNCFMNRVSTFISVPPLRQLENMSSGLLGKVFRRVLAKKMNASLRTHLEDVDQDPPTSFNRMLTALDGISARDYVQTALSGAMKSNVLSTELKVLMFSIVARTLHCEFCISESMDLAVQSGFSADEYRKALNDLRSERLSPSEEKILHWTRETIHFETQVIQNRVRELSEEIGPVQLLEAIGVASLANAIVRLAVLLK